MSACTVHHIVEGEPGGPAVVLVNSLGADLRMWEAQARALRATHLVVRFDPRGHGASPTPPGPYSLAQLGGDLIALLDRLDLPRASLCGVSLGGATAAWVAAHATPRIERLMVCFGATRFVPAEAYLERAAAVRAEGTAVIADAVLRRWFTPAMFERDPEAVARMREMIVATSREGYASCAAAVARIDLSTELAAIKTPTLVVSGAVDSATPPDQGRQLAAAIAGARFVELPDAAHLGNVERPASFNDLLLEHLRQQAASAGAEVSR